MNTLKLLTETPSMYIDREGHSLTHQEVDEKKVISFYKKKIKYSSLPLEEKWKYRKAVNDLQVLINKIQRDDLSSVEGCELNLPEVVQLLKIRKEMLTVK